MSLPWLEDDFKESSKSRSRSPLVKEEAKVDKPVDSVPQKSPRKSKSQSPNYRKRRSSRHSYDSTHSREHRRHSSRHSRRKRRGSSSSSSRSSRSYSSSSSSSSGSVPTRIIASKRKKYLKARLFVSNVDSKEVSRDDLIKHFKKYGAVIDCLLHVKNYAFIQFAKEEDALLAIEGERGRTLRGRELVVNLAAARRDNKMKEAKEKGNRFEVSDEPPWRRKKKRPRDSKRGGHMDSRRGGHVDTVERRQSPPREGSFPPPPHGEPYPPHHEEPIPPHHGEPYPPRHEEPFPPHHKEPFPPHHGEPYPPHHDGPYPPPHGGRFPPPHPRGSFPPRHRGPGPDSFRGRSRPPYGPGPGHFGDRHSPYFEDRYGPPGPWMRDDPFRPPMFEEPFRDAFGSHPPAECEIFVKNSSLLAYGEFVEGQIKKFSIVTSVSIRPHQIPPIQLLEDLRAQKVLFAIFINDQNEGHKSLTLNVLHGSPQEHRNMPVDDAVNFILDSFHKYVQGLKAKAQARGVGPLPLREKASATFMQAPPDVAYLVNLLADNRSLTVEELDSIIHYLTQRRDSLVDPKSRKFVAEENYRKSSKSGHDSPDRSPESQRRLPESHRRSPEPESQRRSQESHRRSLEPESPRRSQESQHRPPESYRRPPESHHLSPEPGSPRRSQEPGSQRRSQESRHRSPESRDRSLEVKHRSVKEGHRRSPHNYGRSPESHRRSQGSYRQSSPMDLEVSQSPKAESPAATDKPVLLTEDLKSKIINILNNVRNAQNVPAADRVGQPSKVPASVSTAAAPPAHAPPLPPPPPLPPLPPNEFDNFTSSGAQGSGDSMKGGISAPATSQLMGASAFPSGFEAGNQYNQNSGDWWMGFKDGHGYGNEAGQEQGVQGPAGGPYQRPAGGPYQGPPGVPYQGPPGVPYQGPYGYPGMHNQMGNYGPPRY